MVHRFSRKTCTRGFVALGFAASAWGVQGRCQAEAPACRGKIGVIADIQYADAWNFHKTHPRRYRGALDAVDKAVDDWLEQGDVGTVDDLGDIIDKVKDRSMTQRVQRGSL
ncbi:hypothetical protein DIPPA_12494 [Diplonema papillatum]|nr:hypothetical protein DIPPA_12494 [Diplonema papillatum]